MAIMAANKRISLNISIIISAAYQRRINRNNISISVSKQHHHHGGIINEMKNK